MALTNYASLTAQKIEATEATGGAYTIQQRARNIEEGLAVCHSALDQIGAAMLPVADSREAAPGGDGVLRTLDRAQEGLNLLVERLRSVADQIGHF